VALAVKIMQCVVRSFFLEDVTGELSRNLPYRLKPGLRFFGSVLEFNSVPWTALTQPQGIPLGY
jgi:hypothetical protein